MASIAVTGASGELGGATVRFLLQRKVAPNNVVAVVRDEGKVADLAAQGVQVRRGDYIDPKALEDAFRGADKLLFISSSALVEERVLHHRSVVNAARAAAVKHILYTSVIKPAADAKFAASPGALSHRGAHPREPHSVHVLPQQSLSRHHRVDVRRSLADGSLVYNGGNGRVGSSLARTLPTHWLPYSPRASTPIAGTRSLPSRPTAWAMWRAR